MESLLNWLIGEAGAAWIIGGLGLAFGIYQWWQHRMRPSYILVVETSRTTIHKLPELQERLSIAFDGRSIDVLDVTELAIRNISFKPLENIRFRCEVGEDAKILALQERYAPAGVQVDYAMAEDGSWPVVINYLNPFSHYREQVELIVFCSSHPKVLSILGGGKDWQVQYRSLDALRHVEFRRVFTLSVIVILLNLIALALAFIAIQEAIGTKVLIPPLIYTILVGVALFSIPLLVMSFRSVLRLVVPRRSTSSTR